MGIQLPSPGNVGIPGVPPKIKADNPELYNYLQDLRRAVLVVASGMFANSFTIATAMNLGVSGTFTISSGGSIIITSGIVRVVTS